MGTRPVVCIILLSTARPPYTATEYDDNGSTTMCHNSTRERVGVGWTCVYMHLARVVSARARGHPCSFVVVIVVIGIVVVIVVTVVVVVYSYTVNIIRVPTVCVCVCVCAFLQREEQTPGSQLTHIRGLVLDSLQAPQPRELCVGTRQRNSAVDGRACVKTHPAATS